MKTAVIVSVVITVVLLLGFAAYFIMKRPASTPAPKVEIQPPLIELTQPPVPTAAPPQTSPPPSQTTPSFVKDVMYVPEYRYGLAPLPPPPPPGWVAHGYVPSVELIPGAAWPTLVGRNRDTAVSYIMTTYPRMTVRAIPYGSPVTYSTRSDRVTIAYDPHTRRVINARIG